MNGIRFGIISCMSNSLMSIVIGKLIWNMLICGVVWFRMLSVRFVISSVVIIGSVSSSFILNMIVLKVVSVC